MTPAQYAWMMKESKRTTQKPVRSEEKEDDPPIRKKPEWLQLLLTGQKRTFA